MEDTYVIRGLSRQAKTAGLPLPYFMAVMGLTVIPFMITKSLLWFLTIVIWYGAARSIVAINPNGHRIILARLQHLPMIFLIKPLQFVRSKMGRSFDL